MYMNIISSADYEFDGDTYVYRDSSGVKHKWNKDANQWDKQQVSYYISK